ncbi:MAG: sigma-70 family RNA polymerase sigma factor [Arthrobacter sp.]
MDQNERDRLVLENLPLVGYLVSDVCAKATHISREDLASVGAIALITAADSYDPGRGVPFGAYARRRIIGSFADDMRSSDWAPRSARRRIRDTLAVQETLTAELRRAPSPAEIAAALGVDQATADAALADSARTVSTIDGTIAEFLVAEGGTSPESEVLLSERRGFLRTAVKALPEKMRYIVEQVYFEDRTVKELAEELGLTHSAVSQQRAEAIRLLQDGLTTHYADDASEARAPQVQSRLSATRRTAYLEALGSQAMGGIVHANRPRPVLAPAL